MTPVAFSAIYATQVFDDQRTSELGSMYVLLTPTQGHTPGFIPGISPAGPRQAQNPASFSPCLMAGRATPPILSPKPGPRPIAPRYSQRVTTPYDTALLLRALLRDSIAPAPTDREQIGCATGALGRVPTARVAAPSSSVGPCRPRRKI